MVFLAHSHLRVDPVQAYCQTLVVMAIFALAKLEQASAKRADGEACKLDWLATGKS